MLFTYIFHHYLLWHYTKAFSEILHVWKNFFWFVVNFFSITQLLKSLFSPWKRITEERKRAFDLEDIASHIVIGLLSRLIGFILRFTIVLSGTFLLLILCLGLVVTYIFWILAPAFIVGSLFYGLKLIFF